MRVNTAVSANRPRTHEGAPARHLSAIDTLARTVMACLLWEDGFYENGLTVAERIKALVPECDPADVANLARDARGAGKLRHVPLLMARELARHPRRKEIRVAQVIEDVIQRADELAEFVAMYWLDGKQPLSKQVKLGLAAAFRKFDAYQLAKYNRDNAVKLRDVLFLCHAKPKDKAQERLWKQLIDGNLEAPNTWEVRLSGGEDKCETFTNLLQTGKMGYMAVLRNLRNMVDAGVDDLLISNAILDGAEHSRALPFRFISAAQAVPRFERDLDAAMVQAFSNMDRLPGRTVVLVDVSGSMAWKMAGRTQMTMMHAAAAMAALVVGVSDRPRVFTFSNTVVEVPPRHGMSLVDAVINSQGHGGTLLGAAVEEMNRLEYDRLIVITDEQSHDRVPNPSGVGYMNNVATNKHGVGYGPWVHIDGFSENVVRYIHALEAAERQTD